MAFETMTKEIKEKQINMPRVGGAKNTPGGPAFGQGRALPQQTPGAEPTAEQINSVKLNKKQEKRGKGGCC